MEAAAKHTSGPWSIHDTGETMVEIRSSKGLVIAEVGDTSLEDEINAHLIAAAPELLDMLQRGLCMTGPTSSDSNLAWFAEVRSLVAKATGSQS